MQILCKIKVWQHALRNQALGTQIQENLRLSELMKSGKDETLSQNKLINLIRLKMIVREHTKYQYWPLQAYTRHCTCIHMHTHLHMCTHTCVCTCTRIYTYMITIHFHCLSISAFVSSSVYFMFSVD